MMHIQGTLILDYKSDLIIINLGEWAVNDDTEKKWRKITGIKQCDWCILYVLAHKPGTTNSGILVCCHPYC